MVGGWQNGQSELEVGGASGVEGSEMGEGPQKGGGASRRGRSLIGASWVGKGPEVPAPFSLTPPPHTHFHHWLTVCWPRPLTVSPMPIGHAPIVGPTPFTIPTHSPLACSAGSAPLCCIRTLSLAFHPLAPPPTAVASPHWLLLFLCPLPLTVGPANHWPYSFHWPRNHWPRPLAPPPSAAFSSSD